MSKRILVVLGALLALGLGSYWLINKTNPPSRLTQGAPSGKAEMPRDSTASNAAPVPSSAAVPAQSDPTPISFMWGDPGPIESAAFAEFKKAELAKLGGTGKLEIIGLYSAAEQVSAGKSAANLGQARAEKTAELFADSVTKDRIKLTSKLITDDAATEASKRAGFFASVEVKSGGGVTSETVVVASKAAPTVAVAAAVVPPPAPAAATAAPAPAPVITPPPAPKTTASTKAPTTPVAVKPTPSPVAVAVATAPATATEAASSSAPITPVPIRFQPVNGKRNADAAIDTYLKQVAARIRAGATATVTGYTDSDGVDELNRQLASRRAESVRAELIALGATASRVKTAGKGSENAVGDNKTDEGRQANRRVEITLK